MNTDALKTLLAAVAARETSIDDALARLRKLPFEQLECATLDHHRELRCGHPEVIFAQGKTAAQVVAIAQRLAASGQRVLVTRASADQLDALQQAMPRIAVNELARAALFDGDERPATDHFGDFSPVAVISAGTADLPVAEEAMLTLRSMRVPAIRIDDVGVAGLHRLLARVETLQRACAIVAVAGMEGALASVVGGLVACPVFAVPTSVGYGASLGGLAALLAMLNSCTSNVSVVNIDNGFSAAVSAGLVYHQLARAPAHSPAPTGRPR